MTFCLHLRRVQDKLPRLGFRTFYPPDRRMLLGLYNGIQLLEAAAVQFHEYQYGLLLLFTQALKGQLSRSPAEYFEIQEARINSVGQVTRQ